MVKVNCNEKEYTINKGTKVIDFIKENLDVDVYSIIACKINNEIKSIGTSISED